MAVIVWENKVLSEDAIADVEFVVNKSYRIDGIESEHAFRENAVIRLDSMEAIWTIDRLYRRYRESVCPGLSRLIQWLRSEDPGMDPVDAAERILESGNIRLGDLEVDLRAIFTIAAINGSYQYDPVLVLTDKDMIEAMSLNEHRMSSGYVFPYLITGFYEHSED